MAPDEATAHDLLLAVVKVVDASLKREKTTNVELVVGDDRHSGY